MDNSIMPVLDGPFLSGSQTGVENPENSDWIKRTPVVSTTKTNSSLTSTSALGKSLSASPIEPPKIVIRRKSLRLIVQRARLAESHIIPEDSSTTIPAKVDTYSTMPVLDGPFLNGSRCKEVSDKKALTQGSVAGVSTAQTRPANAAAGATTKANRKRRSRVSASSSEVTVVIKELNKNQKNDSPTLEPEEKVVEEKGGKGKGNSIPAVALVGTKPVNTNRVSSKYSGSGRKGAKGANFTQNGSTNPTAAKDAAATKNAATPATASGAAARKRNNAKDTKPNVTVANQSKKQTKAKQNAIAASATAGKFTGVLPVPISASAAMPPPAAKIKEEVVVKATPFLQALICRIPLCKLPRKPRPAPSTSTLEKPIVKESAKASSSAGTSAITEPYRLRNTINSRLGSTSDQTADSKRVALHDIGADLKTNSKGAARKKQKKNKVRTSPRKSKVKTEPDSLSKVDDDARVACGEMSSNVLGFMAYDSVSATMSRLPPIEFHSVLAPDCSLSPLHLPSPAAVSLRLEMSYSEEHDPQVEFNARDYLNEAQQLVERAGHERGSTIRALIYLETGMSFILSGVCWEHEVSVNITVVYKIYKEILDFFRSIEGLIRNKPENSNSVNRKMFILSMRCRALLSLKLFKIEMRQSKETNEELQEHFAKISPFEVQKIPNSPQGNFFSTHTTSASQAGSSAATQHTPSPHHPQNNTTVPRSLYAQMFKQCNNTMNLINAHELWEAADGLVHRYHVEEFFISIDRTNGPLTLLTLHNPLADLVRYVKQGLLVLKSSAEIS